MSDGLMGNADPGISEDVQSMTDVQVDTGVEPVNDTDTQKTDSSDQMTERERGLLKDLQREREENKRLREHQQFLKDASIYQAPAQQGDTDEFDLPPDSVPYVSDVQKLAQIEARKIIAEERRRETEERVVSELTLLSSKNRESDPNFDKRMEYAMEILNSDEVYKRTLSREQTAEGVLKRLEQFATFHPMFDSVKPKPASQPKVDEALKRIQENSKIPPTLSGVQGIGATQKSIQDMSETEYMDFFKSVTSKL